MQTLGYRFNQKLKNLSKNLQTLTLGHCFNQKLKNLPNSLRNLTLGYYFNQNLDLCIALPRLQNLRLHITHNLIVPPLFGTNIIYSNGSTFTCDKYENYDICAWKNVFYKSISIR